MSKFHSAENMNQVMMRCLYRYKQFFRDLERQSSTKAPDSSSRTHKLNTSGRHIGDKLRSTSQSSKRSQTEWDNARHITHTNRDTASIPNQSASRKIPLPISDPHVTPRGYPWSHDDPIHSMESYKTSATSHSSTKAPSNVPVPATSLPASAPDPPKTSRRHSRRYLTEIPLTPQIAPTNSTLYQSNEKKDHHQSRRSFLVQPEQPRHRSSVRTGPPLTSHRRTRSNQQQGGRSDSPHPLRQVSNHRVSRSHSQLDAKVPRKHEGLPSELRIQGSTTVVEAASIHHGKTINV